MENKKAAKHVQIGKAGWSPSTKRVLNQNNLILSKSKDPEIRKKSLNIPLAQTNQSNGIKRLKAENKALRRRIRMIEKMEKLFCRR